MTEKHYAGELASWNTTRSGLIPCKVLEVFVNANDNKRLKVRITADRKPYKKGEELELSPCFVYPRAKVKQTRYGCYLFANYEWAVKENSND